MISAVEIRGGVKKTVNVGAEIGDKGLSCYAPMLVKARTRPPVLAERGDLSKRTGHFVLHDVYAGMEGVKRGDVAALRILETTARVSGTPPGGRWWTQAFLLSWQGSYDVKRFLGTVPVEPDGSAFFEAPSGRALYFQALDHQGRMLHSQRTFVQAAPGTTRSCMGCHVENADRAPTGHYRAPMAQAKTASSIKPEAWGSGFLDYPSMVQPVLDKHCVSCHGGKDDIAGGVDLSGGWTWAFNISYETLIKNTQTGFLNCDNMNEDGTKLLAAMTHGSGVAPLTALVQSGHGGRVHMSVKDQALLLAWMDGNSNYHGNWDYSQHATVGALFSTAKALAPLMKKATCAACHDASVGNDWINLQTPELSRILRAPLAKSVPTGLAWCRAGKAAKPFPLVKSSWRRSSPDVFRPIVLRQPDRAGKPVLSFESTQDSAYQEMLAVIRAGRQQALKAPRVDMPGAVIIRGECRQLLPDPDSQ
jgi:hypothetical protein